MGKMAFADTPNVQHDTLLSTGATGSTLKHKFENISCCRAKTTGVTAGTDSKSSFANIVRVSNLFSRYQISASRRFINEATRHVIEHVIKRVLIK